MENDGFSWVFSWFFHGKHGKRVDSGAVALVHGLGERPVAFEGGLALGGRHVSHEPEAGSSSPPQQMGDSSSVYEVSRAGHGETRGWEEVSDGVVTMVIRLYKILGCYKEVL